MEEWQIEELLAQLEDRLEGRKVVIKDLYGNLFPVADVRYEGDTNTIVIVLDIIDQ